MDTRGEADARHTRRANERTIRLAHDWRAHTQQSHVDERQRLPQPSPLPHPYRVRGEPTLELAYLDQPSPADTHHTQVREDVLFEEVDAYAQR